MQSHASRHFVSEHLCDRHPAGAVATSAAHSFEVTEAFGRRCIPKLLSALTQPDVDADNRTTALHVLNTLLSNQVSFEKQVNRYTHSTTITNQL